MIHNSSRSFPAGVAQEFVATRHRAAKAIERRDHRRWSAFLQLVDDLTDVVRMRAVRPLDVVVDADEVRGDLLIEGVVEVEAVEPREGEGVDVAMDERRARGA